MKAKKLKVSPVKVSPSEANAVDLSNYLYDGPYKYDNEDLSLSKEALVIGETLINIVTKSSDPEREWQKVLKGKREKKKNELRDVIRLCLEDPKDIQEFAQLTRDTEIILGFKDNSKNTQEGFVKGKDFLKFFEAVEKLATFNLNFDFTLEDTNVRISGTLYPEGEYTFPESINVDLSGNSELAKFSKYLNLEYLEEHMAEYICEEPEGIIPAVDEYRKEYIKFQKVEQEMDSKYPEINWEMLNENLFESMWGNKKGKKYNKFIQELLEQAVGSRRN